MVQGFLMCFDVVGYILQLKFEPSAPLTRVVANIFLNQRLLRPTFVVFPVCRNQTAFSVFSPHAFPCHSLPVFKHGDLGGNV